MAKICYGWCRVVPSFFVIPDITLSFEFQVLLLNLSILPDSSIPGKGDVQPSVGERP